MKTEKIWSLHSQDVFHFILGKVKNRELAGDLLQEVFLKVHLKKEALEEEEALKKWLFTIARNTVYDHYRKNPDIKEAFSNAPEKTDAESSRHTPDDCLMPIIRELPKIYREALILCDIQDKKQEEAAKILNLSLSGVKSRVQRGRKLLRQGFIECCNYSLKNGVLVGETRSKKECRVCN